MIPETEELFDSQSLAAEHPELIIEQAREVLLLRSLNALRELAKTHAAPAGEASPSPDLEEETRRDPLTGVYNRAYFDRVLKREFETASVRQWPFSVARAAIDNFAAITERFGQPAGDRILQAAARLIRSQTRESDLIARFGGAEFVILMPGTDAATARGICARIRDTFKDAEHRIGSENAKVKVSLGCATAAGGTRFSAPGELLESASCSKLTEQLV
jgi:diguanylate cyclase (GGDEF)-like protein